ncbi:MAG: two-component system response regulator [Planctomycetota bacterium]|nr:MAG: two-component system response regulator [Planctomycetota bacterium]
MPNLQAAEILLVEDNPADVELTRLSMEQSKVLNSLHAVSNGEDALRFLNKEGPFEAAPTPDLVLLDLNLPGIDGREVLQFIKSSETHRSVPVVVLTSSESDHDVANAYDLHANCFISKPINLEQFARVVESLEQFWFSVVKLPGH